MSEHIDALKEHLTRNKLTNPLTEAHLNWVEREIRQLEVAIYDLKTENNLLHEALDQVIEDRDAYHYENNKLRKDADEIIRLNQAISILAGSPRADETDALIKEAKDEGYNQGFREGLAFKGKL